MSLTYSLLTKVTVTTVSSGQHTIATFSDGSRMKNISLDDSRLLDADTLPIWRDENYHYYLAPNAALTGNKDLNWYSHISTMQASLDSISCLASGKFSTERVESATDNVVSGSKYLGEVNVPLKPATSYSATYDFDPEYNHDYVRFTNLSSYPMIIYTSAATTTADTDGTIGYDLGWCFCSNSHGTCEAMGGTLGSIHTEYLYLKEPLDLSGYPGYPSNWYIDDFVVNSSGTIGSAKVYLSDKPRGIVGISPDHTFNETSMHHAWTSITYLADKNLSFPAIDEKERWGKDLTRANTISDLCTIQDLWYASCEATGGMDILGSVQAGRAAVPRNQNSVHKDSGSTFKLYNNIGGVWKQASSGYVKINNTNKKIKMIYTKINNTWKQS